MAPEAPPWLGLRGRKFLNLRILERWKMHFRGQFHIIVYFWAPILVKQYRNTSGFGTEFNDFFFFKLLTVTKFVRSKFKQLQKRNTGQSDIYEEVLIMNKLAFFYSFITTELQILRLRLTLATPLSLLRGIHYLTEM